VPKDVCILEGSICRRISTLVTTRSKVTPPFAAKATTMSTQELGRNSLPASEGMQEGFVDAVTVVPFGKCRALKIFLL